MSDKEPNWHIRMCRRRVREILKAREANDERVRDMERDFLLDVLMQIGVIYTEDPGALAREALKVSTKHKVFL